jgi:beta-lactam-binding protein with PASTA domain
MGHHEGEAVVPSLVGMSATTAHDRALDAGVLAVDQDPAHSATVIGVVAAQQPEAGSRVPAGHRVRIWVKTDPDNGGGGGGNVRAPTGPVPVAPAGVK